MARVSGVLVAAVILLMSNLPIMENNHISKPTMLIYISWTLQYLLLAIGFSLHAGGRFHRKIAMMAVTIYCVVLFQLVWNGSTFNATPGNDYQSHVVAVTCGIVFVIIYSPAYFFNRIRTRTINSLLQVNT